MNSTYLQHKFRVPLLPVLLKSILMFFYIYAVSLKVLGIPDVVHSSRLSAVIILFWGLFSYRKREGFKRLNSKYEYDKVLRLIVITFLYTLVISILIGFGNGTNYVFTSLDSLLFSILPFVAFLFFFDDIDELAKVIIIVTLLQALCVVLATFIPAVSVFFTEVLGTDQGYGENRDLELYRASYASGLSCFTSEGVCKFTIGLVACSYKFLSTSKIKYIILYLLFSVVNAMLARTGLIMSLIGVIMMASYYLRKGRLKFSTFVGLVVVTYVSFLIWNNMTSDFYERFKRFNELKEAEGFDNFFTAYLSGEFPPISLETIMGTSIISGVSGNGVRVHVDGGYLKNYVALGLPLAIFTYFYIFRSIFHVLKIFKNTCVYYVILFYFFYLLFAEFKEYFLLYRGSIMLFFLFAVLAEKKYCNVGSRLNLINA